MDYDEKAATTDLKVKQGLSAEGVRLFAQALRESAAEAFEEAAKHFDAKRDAVHVPMSCYGVEGALAEQNAYDGAADYCHEKAAALRGKPGEK